MKSSVSMALAILVVAGTTSAQTPDSNPVYFAHVKPGVRAARPLSPSAAPEQGWMTFRTRVEEVRVVFTATDRHHRPIRTLTPEQISVFDDAQPVSSLINFRLESELPLRIVLLMDGSDSMAKQFAHGQRAAKNFLARVLRPDRDLASVISFDAKRHLLQDFTSESSALFQAIDSIPHGWVTGLYDAVEGTCQTKFPAAASGMARRAMILLSDGVDTYSMQSLPEALDAARRSEMVIYSIAVSHRRSFADQDTLRALAETTGGRLFVVSRPEQLEAAFAQIEEELRSQYAATFRPVNLRRDGSFHALTIRVSAAPGITIRARSGYFAPQE